MLLLRNRKKPRQIKERRNNISTIFFIAFISIFYELLLTRIFSFIYFYHNTFIIITIALFFFALGHILTHYVVYFKIEQSKYQAYILTLLFILLWTIPFIVKDHSSFTIVLYTLVPFILCGNLISLQYVSYSEKINLLYLMELGGTFISGSAFILIYHKIGDLNSFIIIPLILSVLFIIRKSYKLLAISIIANILLLFLALNGFFTLNCYQDFEQPNHLISKLKFEKGKIIKTFYDYFSRIDVVSSEPEHTTFVYFDGTYSARIMKYSPDNVLYNNLMAILNLIFYKQYNNALVMGAGGGMETYFLYKNRVNSIEAVDISKPLIDYLKNFKECNLFFNSGNIKYINYDARRYVALSKEKYDLLTVSLLETAPASFRAGAHTQNYIFTVEAFKDYINHLSDKGNLVIILNEQKLIDRALAILLRATEDAPEDRIIIASNNLNYYNPYKYLLIYSKKTFTGEDISTIKDIMKKNHLSILFGKDLYKDPFYENIINTGEREEIYKNCKYEIRPVTDNNPFFYNIYKAYNIKLIFLALSLLIFSISVVYIVSLNKKVMVNYPLLLLSFMSGFSFMAFEQTLIYKLSYFMPFYHRSFISSLVYIIFFIFIGSILFINNTGNIKESRNLRILSIFYFISLALLLLIFKLMSMYLLLLLLCPLVMIMGINYLYLLNYTKDKNYSIPLFIYFNGMGIFSSGIINIILLNTIGINQVFILISFLYIFIFNCAFRYLRH